MADAVRITIVFDMPVTPGEGGWKECATVQDCVDLTRAQYDNAEVSLGELVDWADDGDEDVSVTMEPLVS